MTDDPAAPAAPDWRTALRTLAAAEVVAFGPVGFAAATLPETAAYDAVAQAIRPAGNQGPAGPADGGRPAGPTDGAGSADGSGVAGAPDADGAELRAALRRLLNEATPAGRVYAAELLTRLDPAAASAAWRRLSGDDAPVTTFSGCVMDATTVREFVARRQ